MEKIGESDQYSFSFSSSPQQIHIPYHDLHFNQVKREMRLTVTKKSVFLSKYTSSFLISFIHIVVIKDFIECFKGFIGFADHIVG